MEWNQVASSSPTSTIFQTYEWFDSWWHAFGQDGQLLLISVFEGERVLGFAPLMRIPSSTDHLPHLVFVSDTHSDYLDFVIADRAYEVLDKILHHLLRVESNWSELQLRNIPLSSPSIQLLSTLSLRRRFYMLRGTDMPCYSLRINGKEAEVNRRANKYSLRRAGNYFGRQGDLNVRTVETVREAQSMLPSFFKQHIQRWSNSSTPSLFLERQNQLFYNQLVEKLLPHSWLHFSVAELDGRAIAFHFGFDYKGIVTWYKPSFDPEHASHSPGKLVLSHLIRFALHKHRAELDFTIGAEPFKERYCDTRRINVQYRIFSSRLPYLQAVARDVSYRVARWFMRRTGLAPWLKGRITK